MNREIPIIADAMVDREFGTGAVKITPAHDPNDFEVGRRHGLAEIDVMTDDGHMSAAAGAYAGMDRFEARKKIVEDLKALGLLEKITDHTHAVGIVRAQQDHCGAARFDAVVLQDEAAGGASDRGGGARTRFASCRTTGAKNISTGCGISATGRCRGSCGGDTAFRRGTARKTGT